MWKVPCLLRDPSCRNKERDPLAASSSRLCLIPARTPNRNSPRFPRLSRAPSPPRDSQLNRPSRCRALHNLRNRHTLPTDWYFCSGSVVQPLPIPAAVTIMIPSQYVTYNSTRFGRGARLRRNCSLPLFFFLLPLAPLSLCFLPTLSLSL